MIATRTVAPLLERWAGASHERALANARAASVLCSQARVERAEVEAYLADRFADRLAAAADLDTRVEVASR